MAKRLQGWTSRLATEWCQLTHPAPMWPVNGHYQCPTCLRTYRVPWEEGRRSTAQKSKAGARDAAPAQTVRHTAAAAAAAIR
jgi:hypothetical protein